jgi:CRISPR-associated endonuclease Cas1
MRPSDSGHPGMLTPRNGVLVLSGYGLRVAVERGHLWIEDGIADDRRQGRFSRVTRDLTRLVVLGHSGTISFEALRWLADTGSAFVQIDADGRVIGAAGPLGLDDARLRRAQARAAENGAGLAIARDLVRQKLAGQAAVLHRLPNAAGAVSTVRAAGERVPTATTIEGLRIIEADAAAAYWGAWASVPITFARRDQARVPAHWQTFGRRASLLTGASRKATNPANALLNYLYAVLEAEARLAAVAVGCDPGLGLLHADQPSRDSLACDLMEPVRPAVDAFVLDALTTRAFRRDDFFETREGVCRVLPPLTRCLAETAPRWARAVAPVAESVAHALVAAVRPAHPASLRWRAAPALAPRELPTPLTQGRRRAGRDGVRRREAVVNPCREAALGRTCMVCGTSLVREQRRYCAACLPAHAPEALTGARAVLRRRRAEGRDPAHGGEATRRRRERTAEATRANLAWAREHPERPDPQTFTRDILPRLREVPVAAIMAVTGLSRPYCALVRQGGRVPHPRHWPALAAL